ncbi:hypothetical protein Taro_042310 [Colocasia esculenta]|uniref:Pentatricopeptide repeat-containing protein n=1 Tax=Colocasia esculenta TaxID=4460 RepID=A0A843WGH9_COLES|nr:hypothetical protein [Colocasia esculenta]
MHKICEWMTIQRDIKLLPGDYAVHLDLVAKVRGLASAEKFFEDMPERMKGQSTCTALLHAYVQNNLITKAESVFREMSDHSLLRCALPYNHVLQLYIKNGQLDKVPEMVCELKKNTSPDLFTYNLWLSACASGDDPESAEKVFSEMKHRKITADWITYGTLAKIYIRGVLYEKARLALREMEDNVYKKDRIAYCSLISLHTSLSDKDSVCRIWEKLKSTFRKMNDAEFTCIISSLAKLGADEEAERIYEEWESVSGTGDSRIPNKLLELYIRNGMMEKAKAFLRRLVQKGIKPSYTTWYIMAWGYLGERKMDKVLECLQKALSRLKKWEPDDGLVNAVFDNLELLGDVEGAEQFLVMLRSTGHVTTQIYNALLRTYAKAGKMPLIVLERMKKDNVQLDEETQDLIQATRHWDIVVKVTKAQAPRVTPNLG